MAAATQGRATVKAFPTLRTYPVAASVKIFYGTLVAIDASGNARPARKSVLTDRIVGVALGQANDGNDVDNSTGIAGAKKIDVGHDLVAFFANSAGNDAISNTDVGRNVFAEDDQTLALTDGDGTRVRAGVLYEVSAEFGVAVRFEQGLGEYMLLPFTVADVGTAEDVYIPVPVVGKIIGVDTVLGAAITGSNSTLSLSVGGVAVTGSTVTVAVAGSAAGVTDQATPTGANSVKRGDAIRIINMGESTGAARLTGFITIAVA